MTGPASFTSNARPGTPPGRRQAVAGARDLSRRRSRGRHQGLCPSAVAGIRWARVNVVRSNAQMMGGVPSSPLCPLYLLRNALVPLSASAHASYGAALWLFCTGLHPNSLHYGVLKLLLLAAAFVSRSAMVSSAQPTHTHSSTTCIPTKPRRPIASTIGLESAIAA